MPLVFEPNVGQTDSRVKFMARSAGYVAFLTGPRRRSSRFETPRTKTM